MNRRALLVSFLSLFLVLLAFNFLWAVGKPDVTSHEATFLGSTVNIHIEWQSPNPIVTVRISIANKQQNIKVDPYDNRRNPSGYSGEVSVTIGLDWVPSQPFNYVIQLEDELRMKSALVTGKVKVPPPQQPQYPQYPQYPHYPQQPQYPQQPGMQIQPQQTIPQPTPQPSFQPGTPSGMQPGIQPGGQQTGILIVIIEPQNVADGGAMWKVGDKPWMKSGEAISELPAGPHAIEYQDVANWIKPQNQNITIEGEKTLTIIGTYRNK